ncbi:hypothetical protein D3C86_1626770 [compost metagenome]
MAGAPVTMVLKFTLECLLEAGTGFASFLSQAVRPIARAEVSTKIFFIRIIVLVMKTKNDSEQ